MRTMKRIFAASLLSLATTFGAGSAQAAQFSNVYVFGDSLSDAGTFRPFLASLGLPPALVQTMGRYTTNPGPVWSELVASYYGITPAPSNVTGGTIFAQGGARIAGTPGVNTPPGQPERTITTQVTEYLTRSGNVADPNALYAVWGGANDVFFNLGAFSAGAITQTALQNNVLAAATAEIGQIGRLFQAGATHVMVFTLPDIGATPAFAGTATAGSVTALSAGYNTTLLTGLAGAGLRVIPVDVFALFTEIRANPSAFGFSNITGVACGPFPPFSSSSASLFCHPGTLVAANADRTFAFADPVHPTTAAHAIIAQFAEAMIEGPYNYSLLAELPLRTRALHVQGVSDGLASGQHAELGKWTVFASGGGGDYDVDSGPGLVGASNKTEAYTIGATVRTSPGVTLGAAYGQTRGRGQLGASAGSFHTRDNNYSLFASLKWGGFYASGVATVAEIDYSDLRRNVVLGALTRTATASSSGSNASAFLTAGYDFRLGRFLVGPTVSYTAQSVEVNAFDEAGAGSSNLRIFDQKRRSGVLSAGVRASFDLHGWTPWVRVTADEEQKDGVRQVTAMPLSLSAIGNQYDIPGYSGGDSSWTTLGLGVRGSITRHIGLGIAYYKVSGRSGISEQGATATVSVRF
jgi:outer membrane lipase/esterase